MNKKRLYAAVILIVCSMTGTVFPQSMVSETGKTGMSFLSISPSSQAASLGGVASAYYTGASSIWSNPALLALQKGRTAQFSHTEWIEGIRQEFAAFSTNAGLGSLGFAMQLFDSGDIDLQGNIPSDEPLGTYSIKNVAVSIAYAREFKDILIAGITYKKLFEKITDETAGGYAFDGGIRVKTPLKGIALSAVGRNYGQMGKLKSERTKLPSDVAVGCLYSGILPGIERPYNALADVVFPRYGDNGLRVGAEVVPVDRFFCRLGYRTDSDIEDVTLGVGVNLEKFNADMSYTHMQEGFDSVLRFTLSITGF
ncbi:PorV/PorQ family protein [bacterium]|nr:PorV/PorQ family protein [bacterium]